MIGLPRRVLSFTALAAVLIGCFLGATKRMYAAVEKPAVERLGADRAGILFRQLAELEGIGPDSPIIAHGDLVIGEIQSRWERLERPRDEWTEASRFFRLVDDVLLSSGFVFPARGEIDLLRNAFEPRRPAQVDFAALEANPNNTRRVGWIRAHRKAEGPFFFLDCDTSSILYLAAAQRMNFPVSIVDLPGHMFVRWKSETVSLNWDPNEGRTIQDGEYFQRWSITPELQRLLGYGEIRSTLYLYSYWQCLVGQWNCRRGEYEKAEKYLRAALLTEPANLLARNELAWLLATCPDGSVRNGPEARTLAEDLLKRSRRVNWLDTLAAAYAETKDFTGALRVIREAQLTVMRDKSAVAANELVGDLSQIEAVYAQNASYVEGVRKGWISPPISPASVNDVPER